MFFRYEDVNVFFFFPPMCSLFIYSVHYGLLNVLYVVPMVPMRPHVVSNM
jgi:hypothetical protein